METTPTTKQATANSENLHLVSANSCITDQKKLNLVPLTEIISRIRKGTYQAAIQRIRTLAAQGETDEANRLKKNLPYFVFGVVEGSRKAENVVQANGIILDFDHVSDIEEFKKQAAEKIPNAKYVFRSPTDGVKVLIPFRIPVTDRVLYKRLWDLLAEEAKQQMGLEPDPTHDMCRACFVSWDTELITTQNETFDVETWGKCVQADANPPLCGALESAGTIDSASTAVHDLSEYSISQAVDYLCKLKIDHLNWIKVGIALHNHLGEAGKKYWDRFLHNPNYPNESQENLDNIWQGLGKYPSVGIGSLFWIAEQHGWQNVISASERKDSWKDYPALVELFGQKQDVSLDTDKLPQELQEYISILDEITDSSAGAKLTAILPVIASAIGNRIAMKNAGATHYCNIWAVVIGPSSISRKSTVINQALKCLSFDQDGKEGESTQEQIDKRIVLNNVTKARMLELLDMDSNRLIAHTEFGAWMKEMQSNYNMGMKAELTDMFDGYDKTVTNKEVSYAIRKPAFSIVGGTTEEWYFSELKEAADQRGGFLQRLLVCMYRDIDIKNLNKTLRYVPEAEAKLKDWGMKLQTLNQLKGTHCLQLGEAAIEFRNKLYETKMEELAAIGSDALWSYSSRIYDNYFFRFCILIHCLKNYLDIEDALANDRVSSYFNKNRVDLQTAKEAMALCDYYFENTKPFIAELDEGGKLENERKIVKKLNELSEDWVQHSLLLNKSKMGKKEFRATMDSLIEREAVFCRDILGYHNKRSLLYKLNPVLACG